MLVGCGALPPGARTTELRATSQTGASASPAPPTARLSPLLRRMRAAYPDLAAGPFISIADFETPGHELLFRTLGPGGDEARTQPALSILRARNETGAGGLKAHFESAGDTLRFDGRRSEKLALVRDWRPYALLLFSVYGPGAPVAVELLIESGEESPQRYRQTLAVGPGWNQARIDLASVGARIDLGDVRTLSWRVPDLASPIDLYFDDFILVDNTQWVLGEQSTAGELYVFTRGRRIHVGARARFELAFLDGVIAEWRGPGDANLADAGGLGPWPVPLPADWQSRAEPVAYDDPALFTEWGPAAAAVQSLVEVTPFRVVLAGQWRFAAPGRDPAAAPGHEWRYTIYPSGAIYVALRSQAGGGAWPAPLAGCAVAVDGRRGFARIEPLPGAPDENGPEFALLSRRGGGSDLLWTWSRETGYQEQRAMVSADERRLAVLAGAVAGAAELRSAHLLRVWPADLDSAPEAAGVAGDYRRPGRVRMTVGRAVIEAAGDLDGDGFNESEGCYELAGEGGVARFTFEPERALRFDPVFRVWETAGRRCWVYARGRLIGEVGRDAGDALLFRLGRVTSSPVELEVHMSGGAGSGAERAP